ncbi:hypothetical protein EGH56_10530 [Klebsiella aerogenes]|uniref:Uncharacterized protein n=1 Tax=Klebsiella aerogenes (strain ATCC 13048 / DSM 30053 / CCUG 1429 / JCM 1235 / KCTC 2190 / NBRC 13534 / NCIMB 10102 / NCTC 10006 / CDC 819-56) TaxID=1028307 RepID=A0A0H3FVU1_KLEAK|nr:hypothetical protein EAE_17555 [Klebsiella aerogenes KCTC 2190]QEU18751.1 hypothetical protein FOB49_08920 [Klebsiella aerogenes]QEV94697.1 hypothetical protein F6O44_05560 [Klebsiella aerogenes]QHJ50956.1 hypothetical protein GUU79_07170 [Klebsiella aerogenes]RFP74056.1 hypothetical protein D0N43_13065 [Klebsiella aerogenes]
MPFLFVHISSHSTDVDITKAFIFKAPIDKRCRSAQLTCWLDAPNQGEERKKVYGHVNFM